VRPIDPALYPFDSHWLDLGPGQRMHYLDEGSGPPVLLLHGNPSWSFYYRNLILALRTTHRCIAPDHIGMGLSDKPQDRPYTLAQRVADVQTLMDSLAFADPVTLVVHDWGGMIGLAWAVQNPQQIARLVVLNTAAFPLPATKRFPWPLALTRTPLGTLLVRGFNAFSYAATVVGCTRTEMPHAIADAYTAPYDSWADRVATLRFVQDIPLRQGDPGFDIVQQTAQLLHHFSETPTFIGWGARDFVFDDHFLREWQKHFPHAQLQYIEDAGHYVLEDAAELVPAIAAFVRA
jgi:pimeloyl-ACP methyl ester carboxylesterase